jgi:hypothetical protein
MKCVLIAAFAAAGGLAWPSISHADESSAQARLVTRGVTFAPPGAEEPGYTGPNRALLAGGLIAVGGAYIPSVVVAAASDRSADHHLYVPVVGPWLDFGNRPGCGTGPIGCGAEGVNKALIIASGVVQGAGVLAALASFAFPERDGYLTAANRDKARAKRADEPTLRFTAAQLGSRGYGMVAFGGF